MEKDTIPTFIRDHKVAVVFLVIFIIWLISWIATGGAANFFKHVGQVLGAITKGAGGLALLWLLLALIPGLGPAAKKMFGRIKNRVDEHRAAEINKLLTTADETSGKTLTLEYNEKTEKFELKEDDRVIQSYDPETINTGEPSTIADMLKSHANDE